MRKLSIQRRKEIVQKLRNGLTHRQIAQQCNVAIGTVSNIRKGLKEALPLAEWDKKPVTECQSLIESMPRRIAAVIRAKAAIPSTKVHVYSMQQIDQMSFVAFAFLTLQYLLLDSNKLHHHLSWIESFQTI